MIAPRGRTRLIKRRLSIGCSGVTWGSPVPGSRAGRSATSAGASTGRSVNAPRFARPTGGRDRAGNTRPTSGPRQYPKGYSRAAELSLGHKERALTRLVNRGIVRDYVRVSGLTHAKPLEASNVNGVTKDRIIIHAVVNEGHLLVVTGELLDVVADDTDQHAFAQLVGGS
eukprot:14923183-Heterocapsa_arctica.AAC.1